MKENVKGLIQDWEKTALLRSANRQDWNGFREKQRLSFFMRKPCLAMFTQRSKIQQPSTVQCKWVQTPFTHKINKRRVDPRHAVDFNLQFHLLQCKGYGCTQLHLVWKLQTRLRVKKTRRSMCFFPGAVVVKFARFLPWLTAWISFQLPTVFINF